MNISSIKKKAKKLGVKGKMKKLNMVKAIQKAEGNFDCFGTAADYCDQVACSWRSDCLGHKY